MTQPEHLQHGAAPNQQPPSSKLDIYDRAISSGVADDYLQQLNLGLGNYTNAEYWQQVEAYQRGMFADAAFARRIIDRAIEDTKAELALEAWDELDDEEKEDLDRGRWLDEKAEEIWENTPEQHDEQTDQLDLIEEHAGITSAWTPPFHRMMEMRHEASRSRGARLMDNLFDRVRELLSDSDQIPQDAMSGDRR